jgi:hypothetical protein
MPPTPPVPSPKPSSLGRSIWSLFAGFAFVVFATLAADKFLEMLHVFPPLGQYASDQPLLFATTYRFVFGVMGSYLTARLAPHSPMLHAMIGGAIGMALATVGAVATWNQNFGPHWYPIALIALALPQSWLGASLFLRRFPAP